MEAAHGGLFTGEWMPEAVARLMTYLRSEGVPVFEASAIGSGALTVRFEPTLGQTGTAEGLLLAWPEICRVEHQYAGVIVAYGFDRVATSSKSRGRARHRRLRPTWGRRP